MNTTPLRPGLLLSSLVSSLGFFACDRTSALPAPKQQPDLLVLFQSSSDGPIAMEDMTPAMPNHCGDTDPACRDTSYGPPTSPFPLGTDPMKDPAEKDSGVKRNPDGSLGIDSMRLGKKFNYMWIANNEGTTSVVDSKKIREIARYSTVTCFSLPTGSKDSCDGLSGCCSIDDYDRWTARKNKMAQPLHRSVQTTMKMNYPSRTAVDFNGDLFISNRAFSSQSSVTKIAADASECIDRNHNGKIDSSSDSNADGVIQTDCNGNKIMDDADDVKMTPCTNGLKQEYYGLDDECILWTSNTFPVNGIGRPLALAAGKSAVSDAWAGSYSNSNFVRIDGATGLDTDEVQLDVQCSPYGVTTDAQGIAWTTPHGGGPLCYFDTAKSKNVGKARAPKDSSISGYGIAMDRDQNVWIGMNPARYTPDRSNGFANLGLGYWTQIAGANGVGIAADSRNAKSYFVYSCATSKVLQIPASTIPMMKLDQMINPNNWPVIDMPCYGVGVDGDQNVWGIDQTIATRALVDKDGKITQPNVNGVPLGNNLCPAGDQCSMSTNPYTYSDFTGFGLRNFTLPNGTYTLIVTGCRDGAGQPTDTAWSHVLWDAIVPANTTLSLHARAGLSPQPDATWGQLTTDAFDSPLDLTGGVLVPNLPDGMSDPYLQVEFTFKSKDGSATPELRSFDVAYKCNFAG